MKVSQIFQKAYPPYVYIKFESGKEVRVWSHTSRNYSWVFRGDFKGISVSMKLGINQVINALKPLCSKNEQKLLPQLKNILQTLGKTGDRLRSKMLNWKTYDLWKMIETNPFLKSGNPDQKALEWYRKSIMNDTDYHFKAKLLRQGFLYTYNYDTPKYESVLDYFDTQPLMISFGPIETSLGRRDIGINLHLFPPRIRRIIMYKIFEMYRNHYKDQLFTKNQQVVNVTWKAIAKPLEKYGIAFGIRMYIPELRRNVIEFKYEDWKDAIFLPSKKLSKITQLELEDLWAKFVHNQKKNKGPGKDLNESWKNS